MATRRNWVAASAAAWLVLATVSGVAGAQEVPLVTGKQWTESSDQMKKAYLVGIANVVQVETAYHAGKSPPDTVTILPRFSKGLKNQSLDSVRQGVDRWYAAHPEQLQRPVIETIWFEMVVPGLSGSK